MPSKRCATLCVSVMTVRNLSLGKRAPLRQEGGDSGLGGTFPLVHCAIWNKELILAALCCFRCKVEMVTATSLENQMK